MFCSILLCYRLNMLSFCIDSISWCCFVVPLLCWCSLAVLSCDIPIVLPVFQSCASVALSRQYSATELVFHVPCSGVPGFIVFIVCPSSAVKTFVKQSKSYYQKKIGWLKLIVSWLVTFIFMLNTDWMRQRNN